MVQKVFAYQNCQELLCFLFFGFFYGSCGTNLVGSKDSTRRQPAKLSLFSLGIKYLATAWRKAEVSQLLG